MSGLTILVQIGIEAHSRTAKAVPKERRIHVVYICETAANGSWRKSQLTDGTLLKTPRYPHIFSPILLPGLQRAPSIMLISFVMDNLLNRVATLLCLAAVVQSLSLPNHVCSGGQNLSITALDHKRADICAPEIPIILPPPNTTSSHQFPR